MIKQNLDKTEEETRKKFQKQDKRKRATMKVGGAGVKKLQRIIRNK